MYLCICVGEYLCICVSVYVFICVSEYLCTCVSVILCICVSVYLCICEFVYLCICVCEYLCTFVSVYLCVYVSMYLCMWVSVYLCIFVYEYLCICASVYLCMCCCASAYPSPLPPLGFMRSTLYSLTSALIVSLSSYSAYFLLAILDSPLPHRQPFPFTLHSLPSALSFLLFTTCSLFYVLHSCFSVFTLGWRILTFQAWAAVRLDIKGSVTRELWFVECAPWAVYCELRTLNWAWGSSPRLCQPWNICFCWTYLRYGGLLLWLQVYLRLHCTETEHQNASPLCHK